MSRHMAACIECGKQFATPHNEHGRLWCSVGCQFAEEDEDMITRREHRIIYGESLGDTARIGMLCGEPYSYEVAGTEDGHMHLRIVLNFWNPATRTMNLLDMDTRLFKAIAAARDEHGLDKWFFALTREFMPPDKHRYAVVPERHVVTIPAHDLPHRDEVMHITDDVLERLRGGGWGPL